MPDSTVTTARNMPLFVLTRVRSFALALISAHKSSGRGSTPPSAPFVCTCATPTRILESRKCEDFKMELVSQMGVVQFPRWNYASCADSLSLARAFAPSLHTRVQIPCRTVPVFNVKRFVLGDALLDSIQALQSVVGTFHAHIGLTGGILHLSRTALE
eukprot:5447416-Amphidinium_carterae.1